MKIKPGVSLKYLKPQMLIAVIAADNIWLEYGKELVITSGSEGEHSDGSLHYSGYALDFRTRYFSKMVQKNIRIILASALGKEFDVILKPTHMHVEFDPKPKVMET